MEEFVMIFRMAALPEERFSPEEMQAMAPVWQKWMEGMAEQNILVSGGNRLGKEGRTVKPGNVIVDGPYAEIKEIIGGYIIIRAESIDAAAEIAKGCPMVIGGGGNAEVRNIVAMNS